ncbi:MAG: hypothetical protein Q4G03_02405 [Planctomycetia bacterium]|nr:hypothetical protein [Planctomycetia bacterium]
MSKNILTLGLTLLTCVLGVASSLAQSPVSKPTPQQMHDFASWADPRLELTDYHVHIRGGVIPEDVVERARISGVKCGVLENYGREWPMKTNEDVARFIADVERVNETLPYPERLKIGLQVNDRDWYEMLSPQNYARLDYILADTMIMGVREDGSDERLWELPKDYDVDKDQWFELYFQHCLRVLSEPIDIYANPTYLPDFIADYYDYYWTDDRMRVIIQAAIDGNIALEIQAESAFPKPRFIELAKKMGAKFSFGTNNFDTRLKSTDAWRLAITRFNLTNENFWHDVRYGVDQNLYQPRRRPNPPRKLNATVILQGIATAAIIAAAQDRNRGPRPVPGPPAPRKDDPRMRPPMKPGDLYNSPMTIPRNNPTVHRQAPKPVKKAEPKPAPKSAPKPEPKPAPKSAPKPAVKNPGGPKPAKVVRDIVEPKPAPKPGPKK